MRSPVDARARRPCTTSTSRPATTSERRQQATVELDRAHVRARVGERDRERPDPGTDLDDPRRPAPRPPAARCAAPCSGRPRSSGPAPATAAPRDAASNSRILGDGQRHRVDAEDPRRVRARHRRDFRRLNPPRPGQRLAHRDHVRGLVRLAPVRLRREERRVGLDEDAFGRCVPGRFPQRVRVLERHDPAERQVAAALERARALLPARR